MRNVYPKNEAGLSGRTEPHVSFGQLILISYWPHL
jgi:hypothetical protein